VIQRFALAGLLLTLIAAVTCGSARADCYTAGIAKPVAGHYALDVDNRCRKPAALAVCWRWPDGVQAETYRLSKPGKVTFLGPEATAGSAATSTWLHCGSAGNGNGECRIDCVAMAASTPAKPVAPATTPAKPASTQQASLPPSPPPPPPPQWGAIAAGIDSAPEGGTGHAGAGWAIGDDEGTAQKAALAQCRAQGVANCKIVDLYNEGCGYITTGNNGSGGYGWGTASTADRAVALCTSQGLACQKPIGGCVR
jgi:hypothetical protein